MTMCDTLYIVVPCYNEEEVLPETARRLGDKLRGLMAAGKISPKSRVLFVNDGSRDGTWGVISRLHAADPLFSGVDLSRNRGHQNALLAGLMTARDRCDMAVSMDADLQDDVDAVDAMVEKYSEVNLFLRGIVPMIGYTVGTVEYERGERFAGESKYPLKKMLSFAMEGITSLSTKPIRYITLLGFLIFLVSLLMLVYSIVRWAHGDTIVGWASLICSVWAIGGLILLSLGVIGEYIGKIYLETKARPRFLIREILEDGNGKAD